MNRYGYGQTGTCALDLYQGFDVYNTGNLIDTHKNVVGKLRSLIALADDCNVDPGATSGASSNFLVTLAGKLQFDNYEKAVLEAGLVHLMSFNNLRNGRENRMYGYFQKVE